MLSIRRYVMGLSNAELWGLYDEMQIFEDTGVVELNANLRAIGSNFSGNILITMIEIGHEVWRELANRGARVTE